MSSDTDIIISGLGSVINYEYYVILKALQDAGITVVEDNPHPHEDPQKLIKKQRKNR